MMMTYKITLSLVEVYGLLSDNSGTWLSRAEIEEQIEGDYSPETVWRKLAMLRDMGIVESMDTLYTPLYCLAEEDEATDQAFLGDLQKARVALLKKLEQG